MKHLKKCLMLLVVVLLVVSKLNATVKAREVFEGVGQGLHGDVKVAVTIEDSRITDIEVIETGENVVLAEPVFKTLTEEMLATNSTEVDVVSGSSQTSYGFIEAVADAIAKSGIALTAVERQTVEADKLADEYQYDVIVVGAGGAGFSAAIEAAAAGKSVAMLEKMPAVGGNTLISGGEMNAPGNWVQEKLGIKEDNADIYYVDTMKGGDNLGDPDMVRLLADKALESAEWMRDYVKVEFLEDKLFQFGGHTYKRALIPVGHTGQELIIKLKSKAEELGVDIFINTPAKQLIQDDQGQVIGVHAMHNEQEVTFLAESGVVLTTGGFGANVEMRKEYNENMDERYLSTVSKGSTGDGIVMATEVGAALTNMSSIQTYPVANPETGVISLLADTRFDGAILVNQEGERFVEELDRRDVISRAILSQTGEYAYQLWNDEIDAISHSKEVHRGEYDELLKSGLLVEANTLEEVAAFFEVDLENLKATVEKVNQYAKAGEDKDFNHRGGLKSLENGPYYLQKVKPSVHHTMGGLVINEKTEVLDEEGQPIAGLYAAGELTGVIHGANRLGGNAITDIITFGRIAGQTVGAQ